MPALGSVVSCLNTLKKKDRNSEWKKGENKIKKEGDKEKKEKKQGMEKSEGREKRGNGQVL